MAKVVINARYGGFSLSKAAVRWLRYHGANDRVMDGGYWWGKRHDPVLIRCVEELGYRASAGSSRLVVVPVSGSRYMITDYDGRETLIDEESDWTYV